MAFNEVTGHKVAIKILNKKKIKQQGVLEKVRREINVLRQFNHPHIIKHFEFIDTPSDIFIVLEYAAGGELFDLISRKERVSLLFLIPPPKSEQALIHLCFILFTGSGFFDISLRRRRQDGFSSR